jgi:hypothetical protein
VPVPGDQLDIPDEEVLYRRLSDDSPNMVTIDRTTGLGRPSSGAFKPDDDGVSVFRESVLRRHHLSADVVADRSIGQLIATIRVGQVRQESLGVRDDSWPPEVPDPSHPKWEAHALIVGFEGLSKNERIRKQRQLGRVSKVIAIR